MIKGTLKINNKVFPYLYNESKSKKMIIYMHGLDGSALFSKPLFKMIGNTYKIVAIEQRGHQNSPMPASRMIYKHLDDYRDVINHFKKQGYKIWLLGESMGAAYGTILAFESAALVEGVFAQSIPNVLINIMEAKKWVQFKVQFMTLISYLSNINYRYKASVNYQLLSSNRAIQRIAKIADKTKVRQVRETLATWAANKRAWALMEHNKPLIPLYYFQPGNDIISVKAKAVKKFNKYNDVDNMEMIVIDGAKHILMYEKQFDQVISKIKEVMK